jgi:hypothetical protein
MSLFYFYNNKAKSTIITNSQGHSQPEMAFILQASIGIVNRDLSYLRQQAKQSPISENTLTKDWFEAAVSVCFDILLFVLLNIPYPKWFIA